MLDETNNMEPQAPEQNPTIDSQQHIHHRYWIPVVVIVALIAGYLALAGGYEWWPFEAAEQENQESGIMNQKNTDDFADWQTYRNEKYGFEVKYPEDWNFEFEDDAMTGEHLRRDVEYEQQFNIKPVYWQPGSTPTQFCVGYESFYDQILNLSSPPVSTENDYGVKIAIGLFDLTRDYDQIYLAPAYDFNPKSKKDFIAIDLNKFIEDIQLENDDESEKYFLHYPNPKETVNIFGGTARHYLPINHTNCQEESYQVITDDKYIFVLIIQNFDSKSDAAILKNLVDQILSTFKFID